MRKLQTKQFLGSVLMVLGLSASTFGYGLDGTRHSADFSNSLGIWPGYATWSFEGGSVANPIEDIEGNSGSTYDALANHTSDGSVRNHVDSPQASSSGHYDVLNPILAPVASDGYTWEFRAKYNTLETFNTLVGHFWAMNLVDDWQESNLRFLDGYWTNPGGDPISQVKFGGTTYNLPAPLSEWHTYRVAVLGQDTAGDNLMHANLYQDTTLIASSSWAAGSNPGDAVAWMGVNWAWEVGQVDVELDYFRIDGTGAWAPPAPQCGDLGYLNSDINEDCYVDAQDVVLLSLEWLQNNISPPSQPGFQDVTSAVGLVSSMEGVTGVSWIDFNNDGWTDLYVRRSADSVIYHNNGAGDPNNVTFSFFAQLGNGWGCWGDFDNDGFADLFTWSLGMRLYKNNNGLSFTDVSTKLPPGLDTLTPISRAATWGDFNGDGYIDLYVGGYEDAGFAGYPDFILTNSEDASNPGQREFQLTWQESPAFLNGRGVTACDFDGDSDLDLYVSNYRLQGNFLWRNNGTGTFTNVAGTYNALGGNGHTIGSAWGDIDNDGNFDLFVGNFAHDKDFFGPGSPPVRQPESRFLQNLGAPDYHFDDLGNCGVLWQESYASPSLADFDNDGDLDLFFTTVYPADNARLYRNEGSCNFTDVTSQQDLSGLTVTYEAAWADYDNNGYLDLFSNGKLFKNEHGGPNHWLKVKLIGNNAFGGNLSAIGTQVRINTGSEIISRQVEAGTGEGNQNDLTLHFGLGSHSAPLNLEIRWPDGAIQNFGPTAVDQIIEITR